MKLREIFFGPVVFLIVLGITLLYHQAEADSYLPPIETPGMANKDITEKNFHEKVCNKASTLRPTASYTNKVKQDLFNKDKKQCGGNISGCELDHRGPICAGFEPTGPKRKVEPLKQLWLQPYQGKWNAHRKDKLEVKVCKQLCDREITLHEAQKIFLDPDWTVHYQEYVRKGLIHDTQH